MNKIRNYKPLTFLESLIHHFKQVREGDSLWPSANGMFSDEDARKLGVDLEYILNKLNSLEKKEK